jgi:hypothetical protein
MTNTIEYWTGDLVIYRPFGGGTRRVKITAKYDDIKNGRPGFDGVLVDDAGALGGNDALSVWGYDDQIVEVQPWI